MYVFVCVSWENLLPIFQVEHPCAQSSKVELSFVKEKEKKKKKKEMVWGFCIYKKL